MHVIITGGSSGIGLELARSYLKAGDHVSILARDVARLAAARLELSVISTRVSTVAVDVCDADAITRAIQTCQNEAGACDLLITSAGIVKPGFFQLLDAASFRQQIETNFLGTVNAVSAVYAEMIRRRKGGILLVSSAAAHLGIPGYTAYCASKAAVASFAESLRCEAGNDVYIGVCFPPDTKTPQLDQELKERPPLATLLIGDAPPWSAEKVAGHIVRGIARRKVEIHFGIRHAALAPFGGIVKPVLYRLLKMRSR